MPDGWNLHEYRYSGGKFKLKVILTKIQDWLCVWSIRFKHRHNCRDNSSYNYDLCNNNYNHSRPYMLSISWGDSWRHLNGDGCFRRSICQWFTSLGLAECLWKRLLGSYAKLASCFLPKWNNGMFFSSWFIFKKLFRSTVSPQRKQVAPVTPNGIVTQRHFQQWILTVHSSSRLFNIKLTHTFQNLDCWLASFSWNCFLGGSNLAATSAHSEWEWIVSSHFERTGYFSYVTLIISGIVSEIATETSAIVIFSPVRYVPYLMINNFNELWRKKTLIKWSFKNCSLFRKAVSNELMSFGIGRNRSRGYSYAIIEAYKSPISQQSRKSIFARATGSVG